MTVLLRHSERTCLFTSPCIHLSKNGDVGSSYPKTFVGIDDRSFE